MFSIGEKILRFKIIGPCDFVGHSDEINKYNTGTQNDKISSRVINKPEIISSHDWFEEYLKKLSYSESSIEELRNKSTEISGIINDSTDEFYNHAVWKEGRLRKGMVVGSVQSGKTASMMGVSGSILNHRTRIIVLLSGTKTALWHQTLLRFYKDLDNNDNPIIKRKTRKIIPPPSIVSNANSQIEEMYSSQERPIVNALNDENKVLIFIIPKIYQHIYNVASVIENSLEHYNLTDPLHMVVFDDESDDASILDANKSKTVPYAITRLWAGTKESANFDRTHNNLFYATYLAYTATPQANMLQIEANPLAPTDFIFALRTPSIEESKLTFHEPNGLFGCYTGGEVFYGKSYQGYSEKSNIIQDLDFVSDDVLNLSESMMCYVVGAAVRMLDSNKKYSELNDRYNSRTEAEDGQLSVHSMVYHPAAETNDHFLGKQEIIHWLNYGNLEGFVFDGSLEKNQNIDLISFEKNFKKNEIAWKKWVENFNDSIEFCNDAYSEQFKKINHSWNVIKEAILEEIIPNIEVRVINSKKDADDRPKFEVEKINSTEYSNIPDKLSIFVAGNVLSRGLTIENLAVTVFGRTSAEPAADTQMQMQRWFGYRGKILPFVRVFMTSLQRDLFLQYHQSDNSLKERILNLENDLYVRLDDLPYILEGTDSKATKKVDTSKIPLRPASYPQFGIIENDHVIRKNNQTLIDNLVNDITFTPLTINGKVRGYISNERVNSERICDFLDSLQYTSHNPSTKSVEYRRWIDYANSYQVSSFTSRAEHNDHSALISVKRCPYSLAAYLRFWNHVSEEESLNENDLFVFDSPSLWRDFRESTPEFHIVIRCGVKSEIKLNTAGGEITINRIHRSVNSEGTLVTQLWGAAKGGNNQYADQLFDYHVNGFLPVPKNPVGGYEGLPKVRPVNHPALFSIYLLEGPNQETQHGFAIGLPGGGPEHIRAIRG